MYSDVETPWPAAKGPNPEYCGEDDRLSVLAAHGVDEMVDDPELSALVNFAATLCDAPIAMVSVVEEEQQRFIAKRGLETRETPRSISFCGHAMMGEGMMIVPDATQDARFTDNPLVTGEPGIRLYAGMPLLSSEGAPLGSFCVIDKEPRPEGLTDLQVQGLTVLAQAAMRRLSARRESIEAERAIAREAERMRQMAEHIPVLAWASNAAGDIEFGNPALYEFCQTDEPGEIDFLDLIHPEDRDRIVTLREASRAKEERWEGEARLRSADGSYRWLLLRAWPMLDGDGTIETWFGAGIDIDDTYRLSESRDMLARELSHRIKNIFAVVTGLLAIRARGKPEIENFANELNGAIRALGRAHDYVRPVEGRHAEHLIGMLRDLVAPYETVGEKRFEITGEELEIGPRAATPMALVFHELATNSAKYGALSCPEGKILVSVHDADDRPDTIRISWSERAAPCGVASRAAGEGFGSKLLRMAIERQLEGEFSREFNDDGLSVDLLIPKRSLRGE